MSDSVQGAARPMGAITTHLRPGEARKIGDDVFVTVLKSSKGRVVLRIVAPRDVPVVRIEPAGEAVEPTAPNLPGDSL